MITDFSTLKPGGRVSFTLKDGTKIIDSPVTERCGSWFAAKGTMRICDVGGTAPNTNFWITSIDAYTPPKPDWDRPEVFAVKDKSGFAWTRTKHGEGWRAQGGPFSAEALENIYGPCTVLAVYAK